MFDVVMGIAFILGGVFVLAAIGLRWEWFVNHYKVRGATKILGKTGAIVFDVVCGAAFVIIGVLLVTGVIEYPR
jgi:hypothetical protein